MKTFNPYPLAHFLGRITRQVGNRGQVNDIRGVARYLLAVALTVLALLAGAPLARGQASQLRVPVNISLNSVTVISADDVWAVGDGTDSQGPDNTDPAFEHWDGNQWTLVPGQRTLEDQEILSGVGRGWA